MRLLPLLVFWCLWFLNFSTRAAFAPILPLIEDYLSLSHGKAGGLFFSLSIGYSLSVLVVGRFAHILGYKRLVVAGFIGTCLVFVGIQWAGDYLTFHILFFLLGIATGPYLPSIIPIITETYDYRHWGKAIGFHDSAASLSFFAIPILVAFGLRFLSWQQLLLILGIASLLLPIYFWKVSVEPKKEMPWSDGHYVDLFKKKKIWIMGLFWVFAAASCIGIYSVVPLYLIKERGIELHFANTLFGVSRFAGVFVSILIGFLTDRYGYRRMLTASLLATGLSTICLSAAPTLPLILITLLLQATFSLAFFPVGLVAISKFTSLSERSMATGVILSVGVIFGMGSTPLVLGVIADHFSFKVGILGLGVLTTLSSFAVRLLEEK